MSETNVLGTSKANDSAPGKPHESRLPVEIKGTDKAGKAFEDLAHTLDVTAVGARLGGIRHELNLQDEVTVFYRQRKMQFRVVWIKKMQGTASFRSDCRRCRRTKRAWGLGQEQQNVLGQGSALDGSGSV